MKLCEILAVAAATVMLCSGCSTIPATHVLVPARETVSQMQKLSQQTGAVASVITVAGEETVLRIDPAAPDTLAG
jgi:hypothetical protein